MGFQWPKFGFERKTATLASPDCDLLELFGALPTSAGITVSAETALRVPAVAGAIKAISEACSTLPVGVTLNEEPAPEHPANAILSGDWNGWTSAFEGIRQIVADTLVNDCGGLIWLNRVNGRVVEAIRYQRGVVTVAFDQTTGEPSYRIGTRVLDPRDVVHLRNAFDRCAITQCKEAIALAVVMERHGSKLFANGGRPAGVLSIKGNLTPDAISKIRAAWALAHGGDKSGGTAIVSNDAAYQQLAFSSVDSQYLEMRQFALAEISRVFRVPLPMLSDLSRATWSNSEQQGKEFLSYCLEPWLQSLESAMRRALLSADERAAGYSIRFERDDLTKADLSARAVAYSSLIASRAFSPNEIRRWEGAAPYEGGDVYANPAITPGTPKQGAA